MIGYHFENLETPGDAHENCFMEYSDGDDEEDNY